MKKNIIPIILLITIVLFIASCSDEPESYYEEELFEYSTHASRRATRMFESPIQGNILAGSETVEIGYFLCTFSWPNVSHHDGNSPNKKATISASAAEGHPEVRIIDNSIDATCNGIWTAFVIKYKIRYNYIQMELDQFGRWVSVSDIIPDSISGTYPIPSNKIY